MILGAVGCWCLGWVVFSNSYTPLKLINHRCRYINISYMDPFWGLELFIPSPKLTATKRTPEKRPFDASSRIRRIVLQLPPVSWAQFAVRFQEGYIGHRYKLGKMSCFSISPIWVDLKFLRLSYRQGEPGTSSGMPGN